MIPQTLNILLVGLSAVIPDVRLERPMFDLSRVSSIRVSTDRITTVSLPVPIRGLEGLFISSEAEAPSRFQISFRPGEQFFSIRALQTNATGNLNIVTSEGVLPLELEASPQPVLSVTFIRPNSPPSSAPIKSAPPSSETPSTESLREQERREPALQWNQSKSIAVTSAKKVTPSEKMLSNLIERARAAERVPRQDGSAQHQGVHFLREVSANSLDLAIKGIFEFDEFNALVFRLELRNPSLHQREYHLDKIQVESESKTFLPAKIEGEGLVGPRDSETIYFALTGGEVDGQGSHLCSSWPFKLKVPYTTILK